MNTLLKKLVLVSICGLPAVTLASNPPMAENIGNEISSFSTFGQLNGWHALDRDSLIVWVGANKAYLLDLKRPSPYLQHAWHVGVTTMNDRVDARYDAVVIDGQHYPIKSIHALDRAEVKELLSKAHRPA